MNQAAPAAPISSKDSKDRAAFFGITVPQLCWGTLVFLLATIGWGAYVRATGSGAGCGRHWPLCNGEVIPVSLDAKMFIEFTHRVTSGLSLILCGAIAWFTFKRYPARSMSRKAAAYQFGFILLEALLGAGLVLLELVAHDKSVTRTISLGIHLVNTFFLIGSVLLCARWTSEEATGARVVPNAIADRGRMLALSVAAVLCILLLGSSGAMTALGDTLFPAASLAEGLQQDLSPASHFLIQLRVLHPAFALAVTGYLGFFAWFVRSRFSETAPEAARWAGTLMLAQIAQLTLGGLNIVMLAPTAIQLGHLLLADLIWLILVQLLASLWFKRV